MSLGQIGCDSKSRMDALFGARYYDPMMSSWISTDPAFGKYLPTGKQVYFPKKAFNAKSLKGAGGIYNSLNISSYTYVHQNPLKLSDPDGRHPVLQQLINLATRVGPALRQAGTILRRTYNSVGQFSRWVDKKVGNAVLRVIGRFSQSNVANSPGWALPGNFQLAKTFTSNGQVFRTTKSAAKHLFELMGKSATHSTPLNRKLIIEGFNKSLNAVIKGGVKFGEKMVKGDWEFIFQKAKDGGKPLLIHALKLNKVLKDL